MPTNNYSNIRIPALQAYKAGEYAAKCFKDNRLSAIKHLFCVTESGVQPLCAEIALHIEKNDHIAKTLSSLYQDYQSNYKLINDMMNRQ